MSRNRGATSLKSRRRRSNPMHDYDRLPAELRSWLSSAALPWRAKSVQQAFDKALSRTGDPDLALEELNALQARLLTKDAPNVWGDQYPV